MSELVSAYPTSGGIYWWASKLGGAKAGYYTGWLNLIGLLAIDASVAYGCATFLDLTFSTFDERVVGRRLQPQARVLDVPRRAGAHRAGQHLRQPPARHAQQHLGVVARRRRRDHHRHPVLPARQARQRRRRLHDAGQQQRRSGRRRDQRAGLPALRAADLGFLLTQYTITGYDASAHLSEETQGAADGAAKGIWRSIFYSAIGGWILLLAFLFAVQDADGVTRRRRRRGRRSSTRRCPPKWAGDRPAHRERRASSSAPRPA